MHTNPHELFDVVDEADRVVTQATRAEVHARGWLHRAVHAFVLHTDGRVLLQLRSASKDRFPSRWSTSVSGHVDAGEAYDDAIVREFAEELGVAAPPEFTQIGRESPSEATENEFIRIYFVHHDGPFTPPDDEVAALDWLVPSEIDRLCATRPDDFTPSFLHLWRHYRSRLPAV